MDPLKFKIIALLNSKNILNDMFNAYENMVKGIQLLFPNNKQKQIDNIAFIVSTLATVTRFMDLNSKNIFSSKNFDINDLSIALNSDFKFPANQRPDFNEYFMNLAILASIRASCYGRKTGAVIVKKKNIVSVGYNGALREQPSCMHEGTCAKEIFRNTKVFELLLATKKLEEASVKDIVKESNSICPSLCAERAAISRLPDFSANDELSAYCTLFPCIHCAKALAEVPGMKNVYYAEEYISSTGTIKNNQKSKSILQKAGIEIIHLTFTHKSFNLLIFELIHPQGISRPRKKPIEALSENIRDLLNL